MVKDINGLKMINKINNNKNDHFILFLINLFIFYFNFNFFYKFYYFQLNRNIIMEHMIKMLKTNVNIIFF